MERCTRGGEVVAKVFLGEAGKIHQLGPGPFEAVLVVFSLTWWPVPLLFVPSMILGFKRMMPKPLLEADAPCSGSHEVPGS